MRDELKPILKRIRRTVTDTTNLVNDLIGLTKDIDRVDADTFQERIDEINRAWEQGTRAITRANEDWLKLSGQLQSLKAKAREVKDPGDVPDYASDTVLITEQIGAMVNVGYIAWAERTLALPKELFEVGVREVAAHEGGEQQLLALKEALNKLFREVDQ